MQYVACLAMDQDQAYTRWIAAVNAVTVHPGACIIMRVAFWSNAVRALLAFPDAEPSEAVQALTAGRGSCRASIRVTSAKAYPLVAGRSRLTCAGAVCDLQATILFPVCVMGLYHTCGAAPVELRRCVIACSCISWHGTRSGAGPGRVKRHGRTKPGTVRRRPQGSPHARSAADALVGSALAFPSAFPTISH